MARSSNHTPAALWSQEERKRVRERFRATLAGLIELEVLRSKHKKMVEAVLEDGRSSPQVPEERTPLPLPGGVRWPVHALSGADGFRVLGGGRGLPMARSLSQDAISHLQGSRWPGTRFSRSTEDLLLLSSSDVTSLAHMDSSSRASSGFYEDEEDEEDDEVEFNQSGLCTPHSRPFLLYGPLVPISPQFIPSGGLQSVASLCPESHWQDVRHMLQPRLVLDARYRADLKMGRSSEVYRYPSPLHAVALQSPLCGSHPSEEVTPTKLDVGDCPSPLASQPPRHEHTTQPPGISSEQRRLEELILRLAMGYRHRVSSRWRCAVPGPSDHWKGESREKVGTLTSRRVWKERCASHSEFSYLGYGDLRNTQPAQEWRNSKREPRRYGQAFTSDSLPPELHG